MDRADLSRAMNVAATHAAKQAIELVESVAKLSQRPMPPSGFSVDGTWARGNIAAIRRELDDLEHLLAGREPPVPVAPGPKEAA